MRRRFLYVLDIGRLAVMIAELKDDGLQWRRAQVFFWWQATAVTPSVAFQMRLEIREQNGDSLGTKFPLCCRCEKSLAPHREREVVVTNGENLSVRATHSGSLIASSASLQQH